MSWPSERLAEIARRRERLRARAAAQRAFIAGTFHRWERPLGAADRISRVVYFLRAHPVLSGAAVAVAVALSRDRLLPTVGRGIAAWRLWQTVAGLLAEQRDRKPGSG